MILQALHGYYQRMSAAPDSGMPPYGTSMENISFALVLDAEGTLRGIEDLREEDGKKLRPRKMAVPAAVTRTSGVKANFCWDKAAYVLGNDHNGAARNTERFASFRGLLTSVCTDVDDEGYLAVTRFLGTWNPDQAAQVVAAFQDWDDIAPANLVFRLEGTRGFIHARPPIQEAWLAFCSNSDDAPKGRCLITGERDVAQAQVHTPIKGVAGGQTSGGYIVSFNAPAFVSYHKDKADVGEVAAFAYTTALNALLARGSRQKVTIGDATVVFWAERSSPAEDIWAGMFDPPSGAANPETTNEAQPEDGEAGTRQPDATKDDPHTAAKIHDLLVAIRSGKRATDIMPDMDESVRFHVLGLSPNAARLSVRFWEVDTVGHMLDKVGRHYRELEIIRQYDNEPEFPPLWLLLRQTAALNKTENISPVLAGGLFRAMLTGGPYPQSLLPAVLGRIRAEHTVTYYRAALMKACLTRNKKLEVPVSLDPARTDRPYLLGRLFAVLEKAQEDAVPGANATIKDRYLASASANPGQVFHMLLKNASNHTAKLRKDPERKGAAIHYEIMMQEIIDNISDFPVTMTSDEQGLFMIGYYHQRKALFTKKNKEN